MNPRDNVANWTYDLERLRTFYQRHFGAVAGGLYRNSACDFTSYFLTFHDAARLELMQMLTVPRSTNDALKQFTGFIHIAISVGSEVEVNPMVQRLKDDGQRVIEAGDG